MSEFGHVYEDGNNGGYDFTADFDQMGRYLADISDGNAFQVCVDDVMGNYLEATTVQNQEPFVTSSLELDLPDGRIAHVSRFGARETVKPTVVLLDMEDRSYERYTLGDDGALVKLSSVQQLESYDENDSPQEKRAHYMKIIKGKPLGQGEADSLLGLLREGRPRTN